MNVAFALREESPPYDANLPINNPHDKTFKLLFKEKEIAQDIIAVNLPREIVQTLDFTRMKLMDGGFLTADLQERFSDVLYRVRSSDSDIYICILLEHKSSPDKFATLQVVQYTIDLWKQSLKDVGKLPVLVPIVFYHGLAPWNYPTNLQVLIPGYADLSPYFKARLPVMMHDLIDLRSQDEQFMQGYAPLTRLVVQSFKYVFQEIDLLLEQFLLAVEELVTVLSEEEISYYVRILVLYFESGNRAFSKSKLERKIQQIEGKGEIVMNILERERHEGLTEGMERGIEKGIEKTKIENAVKLLSLGVDVALVAEGVGLPLERVLQLKREVDSKQG